MWNCIVGVCVYVFGIVFVICLFVWFIFSIKIEQEQNGPNTLFIKSVQVQDEGTYTCGVTYLDPSESCDSSGSYKIKLNVLGMYFV